MTRPIATPNIVGSFQIPGPVVKSKPNITMAPTKITTWNNAAGLVKNPDKTRAPETSSKIPINIAMLDAISGWIPTMFCIIIPKSVGSDTLPYPAQKNANAIPTLITSRVAADLFSETDFANTVDMKEVVKNYI